TETIGGTQSWKQTFTFDRYGNRRFDTANTTTLAPGCAEAICNPQIDPATNKLVGYQFDNAGNTKVDANGQTFTYDSENKQVQVNNASGIVGQYFYDGDGKRIKKVVPSTGETTIFVYDAAGKLVAEYSTVVEPQTTAKVAYLTNDHLGSPRITTDQFGQVASRHDFLPFGEDTFTTQRTQAHGYTADSVRQKFTGYERDNETDLDFAQARNYNPKNGRFTSTDPSRVSIQFDNPQTWNRYAYCLNNPLKYIDDNGKWPTGTHSRIIRRAFDNPNFNPSAIQRGSRKTDWEGTNIKTLKEKNSPQHAMTPGSLVKELGSVEKAQESTRNEAKHFIKDNLTEAKALYDKAQVSVDVARPNIIDGALEKFGAAMHTVMDNVSPAHRGFQVYALRYQGILSPASALVEDIAAANQHRATEEREPTEAEMNLMVDEMRLGYQQTFGQEEYEQAVSEDQRKLTAGRLAKRGSAGMLIK
ncbi:MAG: RHS repeat-associated core domain-containing protein, partial [Pyrinomonadaceae bacterium]